ncbi:membrane fusion component of efflux system [Campylobacter sputorum subsp. bubulus]|uniref:Membrane fusion component of efflux system n=1 Tax=Campylobacter sputorum subsp. sputorum TaxID=32024 RepID=A0A381DGS7_9BACT|nr:efflux RND transporter periplasmic adaptor subunit [Campylobacter sputorum]ASM34982.1 RND family efflux transporter, membrane fusion subunit [Campylobacter sputorum aubsp. sputorum RM3237]KAB0581887.1 efflux RND transporter periplasmic adaptor subunit [Campylobacter sputorum subsp. sputorum]QEL05173.1 RND family efflux system, membrane fusion protein [Campylobacter sputorum subsp. sputorum]SUX09561.1 membrane fusion component of efflux system [Campylobacter sputorum subsp. sputorum]SUX30756
MRLLDKVFLLIFTSLILQAQDFVYASFDVVAKNNSKLAMQSAGIVDKIYVDIGDIVKKGDVLLELKNDSELIMLQKAQNDLKLAIVSKQHAKSTLDKFDNVQNVTSKQVYENAKFEFDSSAVKENSAKIAIKEAKDKLDKKVLKTPYNGIISAKYIEIGEGVSGNVQPLFAMFSYPEVKLILSFDEKYKDIVKVGQKFIYNVGDKKDQVGKIDIIYPSINQKTRKIYAEVYTTNLTPGAFGEGKIEIDKVNIKER